MNTFKYHLVYHGANYVNQEGNESRYLKQSFHNCHKQPIFVVLIEFYQNVGITLAFLFQMYWKYFVSYAKTLVGKIFFVKIHENRKGLHHGAFVVYDIVH